jgi:hypothetical protein
VALPAVLILNRTANQVKIFIIMRWAYQIRRKFSVALLLAAIFAVMFSKNILNRHNVLELGASFSSVYEDRLMVESYIYKLSDHMFRKKIMIDTCEGTASAQRVKQVMEGHNTSMAALLELYEKTNLTEEETGVFKHFKEEVAKISQIEEVYLETVASGYASSSAKGLIDSYFDEAVKNLDHLSGIQLSEGKILKDHTKKIIAGASLLTQFERAIVITIGLLIMVLTLESRSVWTDASAKHGLN